MAFSSGTATDVHDMLQLMSTFLGTNGWTIDRDAVVGSGRELLVSNGESYFQMRSGTTETLSVIGVPIRASNTVETGIWISGAHGYDVAKAWNAQPGRMGRYTSGSVIPFWLDTNGNTGSFNYFMYAWASPTPEFYLVVEYETGPSRYCHLAFGEMEMIHDWGFTRGVPFFSAGRDSYFNTSAPSDTNGHVPIRGPFNGWGQVGIAPANFACRWKAGSTEGDTYAGIPDPDNAGEFLQWFTGTENRTTNGIYGWTVRHCYGINHKADNMMRTIPSTFNQADVLIPFYVWGERQPNSIDGQNAADANEHCFSMLGVPNHARYVDMTNLLPGDELTIGGDTWQVWPNHYIGQSCESYWRSVGSQWAQAGFAVRKA
jgi:hypothetical protein